jgi:hypothetical protein
MSGESRMTVDVLTTLPAESLDEAWRFYHDTFGPLAVLAVQRHVLFRDEFDTLMADERVTKYVARDGAAVVGLAAMTEDLAAVPLVSGEFFAHRWPDLYAQQRIVYCLFVGVQSGARGKGVFVGLQQEMYRQVEKVRGIVVLDICTYNEAELGLPWAIESILRPIAGAATATRLDSQSYWLYEFPAVS